MTRLVHNGARGKHRPGTRQPMKGRICANAAVSVPRLFRTVARVPSGRVALSLAVAVSPPWGMTLALSCAVALSLSAAVVQAQPAPSGLRDAIANGTTALRIRYRLEHVDQASFDEQALASTALGRWTWNSDQDNPWTLGLEADYVFVAGIEDFNSTTNGKSQYPIIADPEGGDLNQAFLRYAGEGLTVTAGRQRINLGTQRFVGGVAFRQNEQTYDALRVQASRGGAMLDYSYVANINRIFGPGDGLQPGDWYGDTHLLRGSLQPAPDQEIVAFAYLFDLSNDNGPTHSNASYGISYRGEFDFATVDVTLSRQSEWAENPITYDAPLYTFRSDFPLGGETVLTLGYELLGSDGGRRSVRTPLGTMHARQGWTDKFLIAPPDGVRDAWFSIAGNLGGARVIGVYHDFSAHEGGRSYGSELGLDVTYTLPNRVSLEFKIARYDADGYDTDTTKTWFMVGYSL